MNKNNFKREKEKFFLKTHNLSSISRTIRPSLKDNIYLASPSVIQKIINRHNERKLAYELAPKMNSTPIELYMKIDKDISKIKNSNNEEYYLMNMNNKSANDYYKLNIDAFLRPRSFSTIMRIKMNINSFKDNLLKVFPKKSHSEQNNLYKYPGTLKPKLSLTETKRFSQTHNRNKQLHLCTQERNDCKKTPKKVKIRKPLEFFRKKYRKYNSIIKVMFIN